MDVDQYRQQAVAPNDTKEENGISTEKWKPYSVPVDESENNSCGGFDCNICLDSVQDPVVTLCGHLFCWPCIYKWIHFQSLSLKKQGQQNPQCPVCKAEVSQKTLVPLYGRGEPTTPSEGKAESELDIVVPKRPPSPIYMVHPGSHPTQQLHYHPSYPQESQQLRPVLGVYGQTLYARMFVNSETTYYTYPYSYRHTEISSPRVRRHMMREDESLTRICFFLLCVVVFFLFLF